MQPTVIDISPDPRHLGTSNDYHQLPVTEKQLTLCAADFCWLRNSASLGCSTGSVSTVALD